MYVALDLMVWYEENWYVPLFLKSVMVFYGKTAVIFVRDNDQLFLLNQNVEKKDNFNCDVTSHSVEK